MRRHGAVVGISGGVDSSVVLELAARAFGPERVAALLLPERESSPESERLAREAAQHAGVTPLREDMTPALEGFGCYRRRDEAIRRVFPAYAPEAGDRARITLPNDLLERDGFNLFSLTVVGRDGEAASRTPGRAEVLQTVAASNFKQRARMAMLYYHAESKHFAVVGTANRNEYGQGFFVKFGDGGADVQPIVHLYKTQVYALAEFLGVPEEIRRRLPTSDTWAAGSTQEEFFFRLPFATMDVLWSAQERSVPVEEVARETGLALEQVRRAFRDFERKRRTTEYLRLPPAALGPS